MKRLTARQAEVLDLVRSHIADTGYPPTRADIARELGFRSANAAEEHLKALARKGALEIVPGTSRGIRLPNDEGLPVVGRVAAGSPILAQEHIEETCTVPPGMFRPAADFLLRVEGDSMVDAGILDGDLLAVHKTHGSRQRRHCRRPHRRRRHRETTAPKVPDPGRPRGRERRLRPHRGGSPKPGTRHRRLERRRDSKSSCRERRGQTARARPCGRVRAVWQRCPRPVEANRDVRRGRPRALPGALGSPLRTLPSGHVDRQRVAANLQSRRCRS